MRRKKVSTKSKCDDKPLIINSVSLVQNRKNKQEAKREKVSAELANLMKPVDSVATQSADNEQPK